MSISYDCTLNLLPVLFFHHGSKCDEHFEHLQPNPTVRSSPQQQSGERRGSNCLKLHGMQLSVSFFPSALREMHFAVARRSGALIPPCAVVSGTHSRVYTSVDVYRIYAHPPGGWALGLLLLGGFYMCCASVSLRLGAALLGRGGEHPGLPGTARRRPTVLLPVWRELPMVTLVIVNASFSLLK